MKLERPTTLEATANRRLQLRTEIWPKIQEIRKDFLIDSRERMAAVDAFSRGVLSYAGLLHKIFGNGNYIWREGYDWDDCRTMLRAIADSLLEDGLIPNAALEKEFPELYEDYFPEAFGKDPRFDKNPK